MYEIFRKIDHSTDFDSILNVCVRSNKIHRQIFPSKIRSQWINFCGYPFFKLNSFGELGFEISELKNFLNNFGSAIELFSFRPNHFGCNTNDYQQDIVLTLVHQHCKNIRKLDIEISNEPTQIPNIIRSIFSKLTYLHLHVSHEWVPTEIAYLIGNCTLLEELKIDVIEHVNIMPNMPNVLLPKLKKMHYFCSNENNYQMSLQGDSLESFKTWDWERQLKGKEIIYWFIFCFMKKSSVFFVGFGKSSHCIDFLNIWIDMCLPTCKTTFYRRYVCVLRKMLTKELFRKRLILQENFSSVLAFQVNKVFIRFIPRRLSFSSSFST